MVVSFIDIVDVYFYPGLIGECAEKSITLGSPGVGSFRFHSFQELHYCLQEPFSAVIFQKPWYRYHLRELWSSNGLWKPYSAILIFDSPTNICLKTCGFDYCTSHCLWGETILQFKDLANKVRNMIRTNCTSSHVFGKDLLECFLGRFTFTSIWPCHESQLLKYVKFAASGSVRISLYCSFDN